MTRTRRLQRLRLTVQLSLQASGDQAGGASRTRPPALDEARWNLPMAAEPAVFGGKVGTDRQLALHGSLRGVEVNRVERLQWWGG